MLAKRLKNITSSPTIALNTEVRKLQEAGVDIVNMGIGEPDFNTPEYIKEAAIASIRANDTKYPPIAGTKPLKQAIINQYKSIYNIDYKPDQIIVSNGAKQVIFNAMMATIDAQDEVVIPAPYWVSYSEIIKCAEGTPKVVKTEIENDFKITPQALESAITERTKWFFICSPNNPTGSVYSKTELAALAEVLRRYPSVYILSDDIYRTIHYVNDNNLDTFISVAPDLRERILVVDGVSKSYCMTGWRIGYGLGNKDLISAMGSIQSHSTTGACSISQAAAAAALSVPSVEVRKNCRQLQQRRDFILPLLDQISDLSYIYPQGAFYIYINCQKALNKVAPNQQIIKTDKDFAEYLLQEAKVCLIPGDSFGLSPYLRLSYTLSESRLAEGISRIKAAVEKLKDHG